METANRKSLPKYKRLVTNTQFRAVVAGRLCASDGFLVLYIRRNDCGYPRLGVSVGKSCGGAVVRNRVKRLLREVFRQKQGQIPAGFDYLLIVSPKWARVPASRGSKKVDGSADSKAAMRRITF
ncbi:MAG: ribonuclease P protein component, partial [Sedimentisphaerales bacterium]|nr:ribonuclease P protein component [Sedimentisphaerales bacterium]